MRTLRRLFKAPSFAILTVLLIAGGVGCTAAVLTVMFDVLYRPLAVRTPSRLFILSFSGPSTQPPGAIGNGHGKSSFSYDVYKALVARKDLFQDVVAAAPVSPGTVVVRSATSAVEATGVETSSNFFSALGIVAVAGREFRPEDPSNVAVVSYTLWQRLFSGEKAGVGATLWVKGLPFSIIGVAPRSFRGIDAQNPTDFWIPFQDSADLNIWGVPRDQKRYYRSPWWWSLPLFVRLKDSVQASSVPLLADSTLLQASQNTISVANRGTWHPGLILNPMRGVGRSRATYQVPLRIAATLAVLVLLIAMANVVLLLHARSLVRQKELCIRVALGARRTQVLSTALHEMGVLILAGLAGAGFVGWVGTRYAESALRLNPSGSTGLSILIGSLVIAGAILALLPCLSMPRNLEGLQLTERSLGVPLQHTKSSHSLSRLILLFQIALSLTLMSSAMLLAKSLVHYRSEALGMDATHLLLFDVTSADGRVTDSYKLFLNRLIAQISTSPGITHASIVANAPGSGWEFDGPLTLDGNLILNSTGAHIKMLMNYVGPDYFETVSTPVVSGRDFKETDTLDKAPVAIVNESLARYFPSGDAIGHTVGSRSARIIGVVRNSKYQRVSEPDQPTAYFPQYQSEYASHVTVEVHSTRDPAQVQVSIQHLLLNAPAEFSITHFRSQVDDFNDSYSLPQLFANSSILFAGLSSLLVAGGIFGAFMLSLQFRRTELAVRVAIGASRLDIVRLISAECGSLLLSAYLVGVPMSIAAGHFLRSQLYHLSSIDPFSYLAAAVLVALAVGVAITGPLLRALRTDPSQLLR